MKNKKNTNLEMPYERFLAFGGGALTDMELIAVILRSGTQKAPVMQIAKKVLAAGNHGRGEQLSSLYTLSLKDLLRIEGIGQVQAVKLLCVLELSKRLSEQRCRPQVVYTDPELVAECYMERLRHQPNEEVLLVCLDSRMGFLCDEVLSTGTVNSSVLSPRNVYYEALRHEAVNIILLHNHPSGDPTPSGTDLSITERMCEAGNFLDIRLADHIIIGDRQYFSMKEQGIIP